MASFAQTFGVPVGEKTKTWLPVGSDPLSEVRLPLWVAAGKQEGPMGSGDRGRSRGRVCRNSGCDPGV